MNPIQSSQITIIQIIIMSFIGALIGEMQKEIDDNKNVIFLNFFISWLSSGFCGVVIGLILKGTIAKDNMYITIGGSGIAGFLGRKKSIEILEHLLKLIINKIDLKEKDENKKDE